MRSYLVYQTLNIIFSVAVGVLHSLIYQTFNIGIWVTGFTNDVSNAATPMTCDRLHMNRIRNWDLVTRFVSTSLSTLLWQQQFHKREGKERKESRYKS